MARTIQVDDNTYVGYDYEHSYYYVTHNNTTTTRLTLKEAKGVIDALSPDNTVSVEQLTNLYTEIEYLTNVYYALDDAGMGVKAIWFNSYDYYPIVYTGNQLRIGNTDIIHLINKYTIPSKVVLQLHYFYLNLLGLNVPYEDLYAIYSYLQANSYNKPVYNGIAERENITDPYKYDNNLYTLSTGKVVYTATYNPYDEYNFVDTTSTANKVENIDAFNNTITLSSTTTFLGIEVGDKVKLSGTSKTDGNNTYTNDGIYTVLAISEDLRTITVDATFNFDYNPYFTVYSSNATNKTITLNGQFTGCDLPQGTRFEVGGGEPYTDWPLFTVKEAFLNDNIRTEIVVEDGYYPVQDYEAPLGGPYLEFGIYEADFPTIIKGTPYPNILLNVTSTKYKDKFPVGEFLLDDAEELVNYLAEGNKEVSNNIPIPTETNISYINSLIPDSIEIPNLSIPMEFKGTYSDLFIEEK